MNPARIRFVLTRAHAGENLGPAARALASFGLPNLVVADLCAGDEPDVDQMAVGARPTVEGARRVPSLRMAIAGCAWVVGTTTRIRPGQRDLHPRAVAERLADYSETREVALVFGPQRTGLGPHDLLLCHEVSVIPTAPTVPALDLTQAVLLYAWELFNQRGRPVGAPSSGRATGHDYDRLESALRAHLARSRFSDPDRPRHGVIDLMQTLKRAGLSPREAHLWEAVLRNVVPPRQQLRSGSCPR